MGGQKLNLVLKTLKKSKNCFFTLPPIVGEMTNFSRRKNGAALCYSFGQIWYFGG